MNDTKLIAVVCIPVFLGLCGVATYLALESGNLNARIQEAVKENNDLSAKNTELNKTLFESKNELSKCNNKFNQCSTEKGRLEEENLRLTSELNATKEKVRALENELSTTKSQSEKKISELESEYIELKESIEDAIDWFKENSVITDEDVFSSTLKRCKDKDERELDLSCVSFVHSRYRHIYYLDEGEDDHIFSVKEFIERGGGDCEDYSLYMKAYINTVKQRYPDTILEGWTFSKGSTHTIYVDERGGEWYFRDGRAYTFGKISELNPYIICYTTEEKFVGHCIISLSNATIENTEDLPKLIGSQTYEPQNGLYCGRIDEMRGKGYCGNNGFKIQLCENGYDCGDDPNEAYFIITNDDIYVFKDKRWLSYGSIKDKIDEKLATHLK